MTCGRVDALVIQVVLSRASGMQDRLFTPVSRSNKKAMLAFDHIMYRSIGLVGTRTKPEMKKIRGCWRALGSVFLRTRSHGFCHFFVSSVFVPFSQMCTVMIGLGNARGAEACRAKRGRRAPPPKITEIRFRLIG